MRVLEVDAGGAPESPDGVSSVLWEVSRELAHSGHTVTLLVRTELSDPGRVLASASGFEVIEALHPRNRPNIGAYLSALRKVRPDVVHLHGAFYPHLAMAALLARMFGVPYVYSPHGGLSPRVLHQRPRLRTGYRRTVEAQVARHADAAFGCVEEECDDIRALARREDLPVSAVAPPVSVVLDRSAPTWSFRSGAPLVYLGRYEIFQKGLDRMVDLARRTPELRWDLYGQATPGDLDRWTALLDGAPPNLQANDSVYGAEKWRVLSGAAMYVQTSRFEGFPVSVAEAMALGVPCAVSDEIGLAREFRARDLGLVLPQDVEEASGVLRAALSDPESLQRMARNARSYAEENFAPVAVAQTYAAIYERVVVRR